MARLPRVKQKIFAGNAAASQITEFGTIKDGTPVYASDAADIMNSNFEDGWSAAVEGDYAPYRQDRNAVDTTITQQLAYIFQEGLPEWEANTTYFNGSVVKLIDGTTVKYYRSIADNNTSALTDTTKWALFLNIDNTGAVSLSALVPNQTAGDSSTKAANTAFVQGALNGLNGAISDIKTTNLTANRAVVSNSSGKVVASSVTSTELGYVHGVTSAIQTQLNAKFNTANIQKVTSLPSSPDANTIYFVV